MYIIYWVIGVKVCFSLFPISLFSRMNIIVICPDKMRADNGYAFPEMKQITTLLHGLHDSVCLLVVYCKSSCRFRLLLVLVSDHGADECDGMC